MTTPNAPTSNAQTSGWSASGSQGPWADDSIACSGLSTFSRSSPVVWELGVVKLGVRSVVVGTAGHIDHGKSALVRPSPAPIPTASRKRKRAASPSTSASRTAGRRVHLRLRRRARARALREEHARRRRRHRPRHAGRRRRRVGDAADARAFRDLPPAPRSRRPRGADEGRSRRRRHAGDRPHGSGGHGLGLVSRARAGGGGVVEDGRGARRFCARRWRDSRRHPERRTTGRCGCRSTGCSRSRDSGPS